MTHKTYELLKDCIKALNEIPNLDLHCCSYKDTYKLVSELKKELSLYDPKNPKIISIDWCVEDIMVTADNYDRIITEEDAKQILKSMKESHDCNYGITWETILAGIDCYLAEKED